MTNIFQKMSGLEKHIPKKKWDRWEAHEALRKAIRELAIILDSPLDWTEKNDPVLLSKYNKAGEEVDAAFFAKDMDRLFKALDGYKQAYINMYEARSKNGVCV